MPYVTAALADHPGPVVAATDYMRAFADGIRAYVPGRFEVLGTDGFGRSDFRVKLRRFFEIDRHHVTVAALGALAREGLIDAAIAAQAIVRYDIDPEAAPPWQR